MPRTSAPSSLSDLASAGEFERLEDAWISAAAEAPAEVGPFIACARQLADSGQEERARYLLELLDDELAKAGRWEARLALLRASGRLFRSASELHAAILKSLREFHAARPSAAPLIEYVGLLRAPEDIPKTWEKADRLAALLAFDVGAVVAMAGKGVGRVVEVNVALESFKVDLERQPGLVIGFRAAPKLLEPLPPGHILRRKLEDPAGLHRLREDDPPALLRAALESAGRAMTAGEIKEQLAGIVDEKQWTAWWAAARKHPQVLTSGSGRQIYSWASTSDQASASVWQSFAAAAPRAQVEIFRRNADRSPELARRMAAELARAAEGGLGRHPALAFEVWFALERASLLPADLRWSVESLLAPGVDPRPLLAGLEDRLLRERALVMLRERRPDWTEIYRVALSKEADPRVLQLLLEGLRWGAPVEAERFLEEVLTQPRRAPAAFVWLVEQAAEDVALRERFAARLLQQTLQALRDDAFAPFRTRLLALADSGGTLPRLLPQLTEEQAAAALRAIEKATGLADFQRQPLVNALLLRFPALRGDDDRTLYCTRESLAAKREEMRRLTEVEIPANRKAIEEARALGDLRENFEYKAARQRHEYLNARLAALHNDLGRARPLDPAAVDTSEVRVGTRLRLIGPGGERSLTLLGPWESKPEADVFSYESEFGRSLLGAKPGAEIRVGEESYSLAGIEPFR